MLSISKISKRYHGFHLNDINLDIRKGEYFVLTGPSGAGKSVLFEIIAGIIHADEGELFLKELNITKQAVQKRKIGLVFQDNTLFPHLTVKQNISYPLKVKNLNHTEISKRVTKLAGNMGIVKILDRRSDTLSGGEIQRVSIARALAGDTDCLLLDEPLSSLDIQSKEEIRVLLKEIHKEGLTILHITHDQREAFQLAERMAVMVNGQIIQCAHPMEICKAPASKFVADFIGFRNFYPVKVNNGLQLCLGEEININFNQTIHTCNFVIIPEQAISINIDFENPTNENSLTGNVKDMTFFPDSVELTLDIGLPMYKTLQHPDELIEKLTPDMRVQILIDSSKLIIL
jgi:ABC-type sugar transport system ATPase subunit